MPKPNAKVAILSTTKVYVVSNNSALSMGNLIDHCRLNLTAYKIPKYIDSLPKTNLGKILRRTLRFE